MYGSLLLLSVVSLCHGNVMHQYRNQMTTGGTQMDGTQQDCVSPRDSGDYCNEQPQKQMFYFRNGVCQPFMFNGCGGNGNRFASQQECRGFCVEGAGASLSPVSAKDSQTSAMKNACSAEYDTDHLTPVTCSNAQSCEMGHDCIQGFCCPNAEYTCNLRYDSGKFALNGVKSDKYFWTPQYNTCMRFSFYGSLGNANNFHDYNSCMRMCGSQAKN